MNNKNLHRPEKWTANSHPNKQNPYLWIMNMKPHMKMTCISS